MLIDIARQYLLGSPFSITKFRGRILIFFDIGAFRIRSHKSFKDAVFHYYFLKDAVICLFVPVSLASTQLHIIRSQVTQYLFTPTPPVSISLGPYPIKKEVRDYIQKMSELRDWIQNFSLTFYIIEIVGAIDWCSRYYTTRLWIGSPPQKFALIVDTGSTVTYVPCSTCEQCGKHQVNFEFGFKIQFGDVDEHIVLLSWWIIYSYLKTM